MLLLLNGCSSRRASKRRLSHIASLSKPLSESIAYPHGEYSVPQNVFGSVLAQGCQTGFLPALFTVVTWIKGEKSAIFPATAMRFYSLVVPSQGLRFCRP